MKSGFRQSMAWLHTWSGLLLGWLLFAIFLTGTISYFRDEVTWWMQPDLHGAATASAPVAPEIAADRALARLQAVAPGAERWFILLPDAASRPLTVIWRDPQARGDGGGRRGWSREIIDPASGAVQTPRETQGGNFLYRFHFELYALPRSWARWIVGVATLAMFVAILSGIITHKKIFADFFTFRPAKGQRSWLDAHAATAVLALPFHIMITYSGLLLLGGTLIPWTSGDLRHRPEAAADARPASSAAAAPLVSLAPLMADAEARWGQPVGFISIDKPAGADRTVELTARRSTRLTSSSGGPGAGADRLRYDGAGHVIDAEEAVAPSAGVAVHNALGALHRARFADTPMRWLFFLSGVGGTAMIATGMVLWVVKRARRQPASRGRRLVEGLNVGGMAGLTAAVAVYFWANRVIPASLPGRAEWEIGAFFAAWLVLLVHPLVRPARRAWVEQLAIGAILFAGLPVLNALTSAGGLPTAVARGDWVVAGFDLVALATGLALAWAAGRVALHQPATGPRRSGRMQSPDDGVLASQGGQNE